MNVSIVPTNALRADMLVRPYGSWILFADTAQPPRQVAPATPPQGGMQSLPLKSLSDSLAARRIANNRRFSGRVGDIGTNDIINRIVECRFLPLAMF